MLAVVFVRHAVTAVTGQRLGGLTPTSLSEEGRGQAEAVARRLAGLDVLAVCSSPVDRATETAARIADPHGLDVDLVDGVREVDYGAWTDRPLDDVREEDLWGPIQQTPSRVTFPAGESIRQAQWRAVDAVERLVREHDATRPESDDEPPSPPTIVVVSHADIIKAAVAHFVGSPLDHFQRFAVGPASVTTLLLATTGMPLLVGLNDRGHLNRGG